ncbi:MAG: 50S ribosomal protein L35 [Planctomycetota bacterium]|nr:MAG: 50S ribosomal protein L35 [Planctomycetota bacterium]
MPKQKTHKGLAKRVKITGRGKVKRRKSFVGHLLSGRSSKKLRRLHKTAVLGSADAKRTLKALGK